MIKKYPSKVSFGLLIFIFSAFFGPIIFNLIKGQFDEKMLKGVLILVVVFIFILHMFFKTQYIINNERVDIKCGFFSYGPILIEEIKEISKTRSIISSPAPSFDRIEIKYGKYDEIIVSPKDKFGFAEELTKLNPKIKNNLIKK
jgi:hypothetical protein